MCVCVCVCVCVRVRAQNLEIYENLLTTNKNIIFSYLLLKYLIRIK